MDYITPEMASNLFTFAGKVAIVVTALWLLSKNKVAADLVPILRLYFQTRDEAKIETDKHTREHSDLRDSISRDLGRLQDTMAGTADDKARLHTNPLSTRLENLEDKFERFVDHEFKEHRSEVRGDLAQIFGELRAVATQVGVTHSKERV